MIVPAQTVNPFGTGTFEWAKDVRLPVGARRVVGMTITAWSAADAEVPCRCVVSGWQPLAGPTEVAWPPSALMPATGANLPQGVYLPVDLPVGLYGVRARFDVSGPAAPSVVAVTLFFEVDEGATPYVVRFSPSKGARKC